MKYYRWRIGYPLQILAIELNTNYIKNWDNIVSEEQLGFIGFLLRELYNGTNIVKTYSVFEPPRNAVEDHILSILKKLKET